MKTLSMKVLGSCLVLSLVACGGTEAEVDEPSTNAGEGEVSAMATCYAYLLDGANFSGAPLNPFPVTGNVGDCVNLPAGSDNLTSSFRLAGCAVRFFDGPNCSGASFVAPTSANVPLAFDNLTTSIRFQ